MCKFVTAPPGTTGTGAMGQERKHSQWVLGVVVHLSHSRLREETKAEEEQKLGL